MWQQFEFFCWAWCMAPCLLGLYAIRGSYTQARHVEVGFDLDGFVTVWDEG